MSLDRRIVFLTHAEVQIDPNRPVPDWALSEKGHARHAAFAQNDVVGCVTAIYASHERKASQGAAPVALARGIKVQKVTALAENDRSATGYLPAAEFEQTADAFFAQPDTPVRGWERARAAQARIVAATRTLAELEPTSGDILIVAHGGVGALLRCHLLEKEITRDEDQPPGGGCYFVTDQHLTTAPTTWRQI